MTGTNYLEMETEFQRFANWYNVEAGMNLQVRLEVRIGEWKSSERIKASLELWRETERGDNIHVIILNPKHFYEECWFVLNTVAHYMAVAKFGELGIQVMSAGQRYNATWRDSISTYGLHCVGENPNYGWQLTDFTSAMLNKVLTEFRPNEDAYKLLTDIKPTKKMKVQSQVGFRCPECGLLARAVSNYGGNPTPLICGCTAQATRMVID